MSTDADDADDGPMPADAAPMVARVDRWRFIYYSSSRGIVVERYADRARGWMVVDAKCPMDGRVDQSRLEVFGRWWVIRSATDLELRMWEWREPVK